MNGPAYPEKLSVSRESLRIGEGFRPADTEVLQATLQRFLPYIEGDYCLGGGVATQAQLMRSGESVEPRPLNDIDIIMRRLEDINPAVATDFYLWHWHPEAPNDGIYAALVDKQNALTIDIFGWQRFPPDREMADLEGEPVYVRSTADLLTIFISAMYHRVTTGKPMIRKQFVDAQTLLAVASVDKVEYLWRSRHPDNPITAKDALKTVGSYIAKSPDCFQEKSIDLSAPFTCHDCVSSEQYSVAPMEEVYALLQTKK